MASILRVDQLQNLTGTPVMNFSASGQVTFAGGFTLPTWTTSGRPASPVVGTIGYNTTEKYTEVYTGSVTGWKQLGTAAIPFSATFQPILTSPSRTGPTSLGSTYSGTSLSGQVSISSGQQLWTVPTTGTYRIKAFGAQGGCNSSCRGGGGATVQGDFNLTAGEVIKILVGSPGALSPNDCDTGGGGGTYVVRSPYNTEASILCIAAGGGGASNQSYNTQGCGDRTLGNTQGAGGKDGQGGNTALSGDGGAAGVGGTAGTRNGTSRGNPGGGFFSGGGSGSSNPTWSETSAGFSYLDGGNGGTPNDTTNSFGGFGGGGGGHGNCFISGGGGGGWNGGGCQIQYTSKHGGCGGGSYNSGSNQINTSGANFNASGVPAFGKVEVTLL
jgi:hypothetical protein